jgi:hypothetical protein
LEVFDMFAVRAGAWLTVLLLGAAWTPPAGADPVKVLRPQGSAHGFVEVQTLAGKRIGVGDLLQKLRGSVVTSRLVLRFFDGSVDDETTIYSERGTMRFISDHHVQRGPSFPTPIDETVDAVRGLVIVKDENGKQTQAHVRMPPDVYNGLASTVLMNLPTSTTESKIAVVVAAPKPRIIHLEMKSVGETPITMGGAERAATDYRVHVELGGLAGVVAPLIGKQPLDYHVLVLSGDDPAFLREEGPLYVGGPVWRIQQISAEFPDEAQHGAAPP